MPILKETEIKKDIAKKDFKQCYLIYGEERFLISYYTENMVKSILGGAATDFNLQVFESKATIGEISAAADTLPLMSDKKCVLIRDFDFTKLNKDNIQSFEQMIVDLPKTTVLIFNQLTDKTGFKKTTFLKKAFLIIKENGGVLELNNKTPQSLKKQLIAWANKRGCLLSDANAQLIIDYNSNNLTQLSNELQKLCSYCSGSEITIDAIDLLVTKNLNTTVFIMARALLSSNYSEAYSKLDLLLKNGEDPIMILAALSSLFIDMYRVKLCEKNNNIKDLTNYFGYKNQGFKLNNARRDSLNLSIKDIGKIIEELLCTDINLKTKRGDKRIYLEQLFAKIILIKRGA